MTAAVDPTVRPTTPQIPEPAAPPRLPTRRSRATRPPAVVWSANQLPTPAPPVLYDRGGPIALVVEFLATAEAGTTRAQRFLDAHPACGPAGCVHCATSVTRCPDCRVASWARVAVYVAKHRAKHTKDGNA